MRLLTFDPGKENFAFCLFEDGYVLNYGFAYTLNKLSADSFNKERDAFCDEVRCLITKCGQESIDSVVLERYMIRPGKGIGGNGEWINLMIGMISAEAGRVGIQTKLVTAASWKNYMKKRYSMPKKGMISVLGNPSMTNHEADAIGIACYIYENEAQIPCVYTCL